MFFLYLISFPVLSLGNSSPLRHMFLNFQSSLSLSSRSVIANTSPFSIFLGIFHTQSCAHDKSPVFTIPNHQNRSWHCDFTHQSVLSDFLLPWLFQVRKPALQRNFMDCNPNFWSKILNNCCDQETLGRIFSLLWISVQPFGWKYIPISDPSMEQ